MIEKIQIDSTGELYDISKMVNTTHAELKALRDAGQLVAGMQYRITDYVATTIDPESRSANHPFDVIVTADDAYTLNENARAIAHEGDTYFNECNLAAWQLKYCLDNDTRRFSWAQVGGESFSTVCSALGVSGAMTFEGDNDTTVDGYPYRFSIFAAGYDVVLLSPLKEFSTTTICYALGISTSPTQIPIDSITRVVYEDGKGVVYRMIDENNNDIPYDFKGIQFKRYKVTATDGTSTDLVGRWSAKGVKHLTVDENDFRWSYLFNVIDGEDNYDGSVGSYLIGKPQNCKSGHCFGMLINGVCMHSMGGECCYSWTCGDNCCSWTCGDNCYSWTCGNNCCPWTCGDNCYSWTCGNNCHSWTCGDYCRSWTCGDSCYSWTCGNNCYSWTCGDYCYCWTCGDYCHSWTCGNHCCFWTCGDDCIYFRILNGTGGSSSTNKLTIPFVHYAAYCQYAGFNKAGELKVWVPADLV